MTSSFFYEKIIKLIGDKMKPIIGIIERETKLPSNNEILYINKEISESITKSNGIPISINIENIKEIINKIDGIILQGGDNYKKEEINLVKYLYENNIPTLGICLGMQTMAVTFNGELKETNNHLNTNHIVKINKNSKLYKIIQKDNIIVNSRHKFKVKNTSLNITGYSEDNIPEIIEDKEKQFFVGVEWHPESLKNNDSKKLFDYFIKKAGEYNDTKRNIKNNTW